MTISDVKKVYTDVFALPDDRVLDLVLAVVVNMYIKTDPLWLLLVGAPSSGKSEIIQALYKIPKVYEISDLTENSFLSGMSSSTGEASFLKEMGVYGTIAMKDFTSVLSYRAEKRDNILAQMRHIYDGHISKKTGKQGMLEWKGKCNLIGGVTEAIFLNEDESASMGRRNILYMLPEQDPFDMMKASRDSRATDAIRTRREAIQEAFAEYVNEIKETIPNEPLLAVASEYSHALEIVSNFATYARTPITRDRYSREITFVHKREMPVRFSEQLHTFAETLQFMHGGVLEEDLMETLYKIAFDSIPSIRRQTLLLLTEYDKITTKGAALRLGLSTLTSRRTLEDLNALKLVTRIPNGPHNKDWWVLDAKFCDIITQYAGVEHMGGDLDSTESDVDEGEAMEQSERTDATFDKF